MNLSEAERQVLATLQGAELEAQPTDQASLEKRGERYWIFLEDWSLSLIHISEPTRPY